MVLASLLMKCRMKVIFHAGTATIYIQMISGFWWLFHTAMIFWNIWFPLNARHFDISGYTKYVHIVVVILALTLPVIPVGVVFGTGGFVTSSFTISLSSCFPRNKFARFYSFALPTFFVYSVGITLNILSIWKLLKTRLDPKKVIGIMIYKLAIYHSSMIVKSPCLRTPQLFHEKSKLPQVETIVNGMHVYS